MTPGSRQSEVEPRWVDDRIHRWAIFGSGDGRHVAEVDVTDEYVAVDKLGFNDLMRVAQRLLDEHYPHDTMAAMADDPGPKLTLALRECMEAMRS